MFHYNSLKFKKFYKSPESGRTLMEQNTQIYQLNYLKFSSLCSIRTRYDSRKLENLRNQDEL